MQLYRWSRDNRAEVASGWITEGRTLADLAERAGLPAGNLIETVKRYNSYCALGEDADFHRSPGSLWPIDDPPYFAVRLWPGGPSTQGGPRRNHRAQVMHVRGEPIPRLYAAGELGSIFGMLYPAPGGNLAECIAFGRIAAEEAVRESSLNPSEDQAGE